jgi:hypothetical protein
VIYIVFASNGHFELLGLVIQAPASTLCIKRVVGFGKEMSADVFHVARDTDQYQWFQILNNASSMTLVRKTAAQYSTSGARISYLEGFAILLRKLLFDVGTIIQNSQGHSLALSAHMRARW